MKLDCSMYSTLTNLKDGYSLNKMWSSKSLVTLKFESRSSLHAALYE